MSNTRKFFHDRFILFMLTINVFLASVIVISVFFRLGDTSENYIQSFRSNLGLSAITVGGVGEIISFAIFAVALTVAHVFMGLQFYKIRITVAWTLMVLTSLLLLLCLIVSSALLQLR